MTEKENAKGVDTAPAHTIEERTIEERRNMTDDDIKEAIRNGSIPQVHPTKDTIESVNGWEADALIDQLDKEIEQAGDKSGIFDIEFKNPKHFTWLLVVFASMGGLLSGLDQSLISGANLFLPEDLGLTTQQNALVNSGMPLGAVAGAFILSPCNEWFGRKWSIIISCILYTIGGALEAGAVNYGMIIAARVILGMGVGLEVSSLYPIGNDNMMTWLWIVS